MDVSNGKKKFLQGIPTYRRLDFHRCVEFGLQNGRIKPYGLKSTSDEILFREYTVMNFLNEELFLIISFVHSNSPGWSLSRINWPRSFISTSSRLLRWGSGEVEGEIFPAPRFLLQQYTVMAMITIKATPPHTQATLITVVLLDPLLDKVSQYLSRCLVFVAFNFLGARKPDLLNTVIWYEAVNISFETLCSD